MDFAFVTYFQGGGVENYLGGGLDSGVWDAVLFFVSQVVFPWILLMLMTKLMKLQVCHAMLCSVVVWCGLVRCKVVSCSVVCCGVLRSAVVCDPLWCAVLCRGGG